MDETQSTCTFETKLEDLERSIIELQMQRDKVLKEIEEAKAEVDELIDQNLVIAFVEELEKAHQYFDFEEYFKECFDAYVEKLEKAHTYFDFNKYFKERLDTKDDKSIRLILGKSDVWKERFNEIDDHAFRTAINAHILKKKIQQEIQSRYDYTNWLVTCDSITSESDIEQDEVALRSVDSLYPGLSWDERMCELNNYKLFLSLWVYLEEDKDKKFKDMIQEEHKMALANLAKIYDYYAAGNSIYDLVFTERQAKHVMDPNEIQHLMESRLSTYNILVKRFKEMMISSHTRVLVKEIPYIAPVYHVKEIFSQCGEIEDIERISYSVEEGSVMSVTYKEPAGAHRACSLKNPEVCKCVVEVVRVYNYSPPESHNNDIEDEEPTVEHVKKFISSMRDKTCEKYGKLKLETKLQFEDVEAACCALVNAALCAAELKDVEAPCWT